MNCWFCNQPTIISDKNYNVSNYNSYCQSESCRPSKVTYVFVGLRDRMELSKIQFVANINSTNYHIGYFILDKVMEVYKIIPQPGDHLGYQEVLSMDYDSLILTPQNVQHRLPIIITFS